MSTDDQIHTLDAMRGLAEAMQRVATRMQTSFDDHEPMPRMVAELRGAADCLRFWEEALR